MLKSPNKIKIWVTVIEKIDDSEKDIVQRKVHDFWFWRQIPIFDKILVPVNEDFNLPHFSWATLHRLLKNINFEYSKSGHNSTMIDKDKIVIWSRFQNIVQEDRQFYGLVTI